MTWVGHVALGVERGAYKILVGNIKEGSHFEDIDVGRRMNITMGI
jgi:hypothetical protein